MTKFTDKSEMGGERCVIMPRLAFYLRSFCVNLPKSLLKVNLFP